MRENKDYLSKIIDGDFETHNDYMALMHEKSCKWTTEAEIIAAANYYNVDIYVKNAMTQK